MATSPSSLGARTPTTAIVWFKPTDLRLADNEPLVAAHASASRVLHVFVFDPVWHGRTAFGFPKCGHHRARFVLEAVADLRSVGSWEPP
jgi:deoxyribodipyrimidine photo-lyase